MQESSGKRLGVSMTVCDPDRILALTEDKLDELEAALRNAVAAVLHKSIDAIEFRNIVIPPPPPPDGLKESMPDKRPGQKPKK